MSYADLPIPSQSLTLRLHKLILREAQALGWWTPAKGRDFDLFVFGVRAHPRQPDRWDDLIGVIWWQDGAWRSFLCPGTTDPGVASMVDGDRHHKGTARVLPGRYPRVWKLGKRADGIRDALVQVAPVTVQRDDDGNGTYNEDSPTDEGFFAILLHEPYAEGLSVVGAASAGCLVPRRALDAQQVFRLVKAQADAGLGDVVSLHLFDLATSPALTGLFALE